jgi:hypothetical protein
MANEDLPDLHVTGFNVQAGVRHGGLGDTVGADLPLIALEIEGRPRIDAPDQSLWLRVTVDIARALATDLIEHADRAEQLARRPGDPSQD